MMTYIDKLYIVHDEFLVLPYLDVSYITKKKTSNFRKHETRCDSKYPKMTMYTCYYSLS